MKQFIASIYIVILVLCGLTFERPAHIQSENQNNSAGHSASEGAFYSASYSVLSNLGLNDESSQNLIPGLFSYGHKYPFGDLSTKKNIELANNHKISVYLYFAKYQVVRFDGPDIIHPFHYFW